MDNLSKEDIDYIFKEGAKREEFPFKESAWDNMESMLDAQDNRRLLYWRTGFVLAFISLLSLGVFFYSNIKEDKPSTAKPNQEIASTSSVSKNPQSVIANKNDNDKTLYSKETTAEQNNAKKELLIQNSKNQKQQNVEIHPRNTKTLTTQYLPHHTNTQHYINLKESVASNINVINVAPSTLLNDSKKLPEVNEIKKHISDQNSSFTTVASLPRLSLAPFLLVDLKNSNHKEIQPVDFKTNRLSYRLMLGKEWSSVGAMQKITGGHKVGAEVAYQFGGKFQISTGFGVSLKKYETEGTNTTGLQARIAWADDVPPETVLGKCTVFEIPLDFNYYLGGYKRNGFFVGGGLNTYLMANEWYDFKFAPQYEAQNDLYWTTQDKNMKMRNHLFSIVSAQVGYQHNISDNLALQIAPYIQIPLTGIGMGDVNLISTGVQMKLAFAR